MSAPTSFVRSLIAYGQENGRAALAAIRAGAYTTITENGGKQLTGVAAGGKSFTYTVPQGLSTVDLVGYVQEALEWFDTLDDDQRQVAISRAPISSAVIRFQ